ncbi:nucleoside hydrolase [Alienimonas chondri]|uniref:Inosine/uridine-preferring nucleoside hydrolase domain-containing protein n=1 Tax=Alienimonas chondri TaxID=2681879 RepID=A0ABX1VEV4_9PLAN|nr:nucleoside hydrolase [Alienimonas chondri]NNJ26254.1 hypothetical protein [Alienimonas chondri]
MTPLLLLSLCLQPGSNEPADAAPVPVIFDTDMAGDCDDVGALAVLHALADRGEAEILAVMTNSTDPAGLSGAACDVINTFYGRPDLPLASDKQGAVGPVTATRKGSSYTPVLAEEFPHDAPPDAELPDALPLYRETLAAAADGTVVICSVGALSNLEDLLNSGPDAASPLSGEELIARKVKRLVVMGGHFPRSAKPEWNLRLDPPAAVSVAVRWPTEALWQGFEVGAKLICGAGLKDLPEPNPIRRAFEIRPYMGGRSIDRGKPAYDQATLLLAVRGPQESLWTVSPAGRVVVDSDAHTEWVPDDAGRHRFVSIKGRPNRLAALIDELMAVRGR